jgi:hypothetical protein
MKLPSYGIVHSMTRTEDGTPLAPQRYRDRI